MAYLGLLGASGQGGYAYPLAAMTHLWLLTIAWTNEGIVRCLMAIETLAMLLTMVVGARCSSAESTSRMDDANICF